MKKAISITLLLILLTTLTSCGKDEFALSETTAGINKDGTPSSPVLGDDSSDDTPTIEEIIEELENGEEIEDILPESYLCWETDNNRGVTICHFPNGNENLRHDICVGESAIDAHLDHDGDYLGPCL